MLTLRFIFPSVYIIQLIYFQISSWVIFLKHLLRFSSNCRERKVEHSEMKKVNIITFNRMVRDKIMKKTMCEKAAASCLTFNHLKCAFARNGYDGLYSIMSEEVDKKPRVTKQKKIIERISNYFSRL